MIRNRFKIKDIFKLSSKNILVLSGEILEGQVEKGDKVTLVSKSNEQKFEVIGVEMIDVSIGEDLSSVGLIVDLSEYLTFIGDATIDVDNISEDICRIEKTL